MDQKKNSNNTVQAEQDYSGQIADKVFIVFAQVAVLLDTFHMRSSIDQLMNTLCQCHVRAALTCLFCVCAWA